MSTSSFIPFSQPDLSEREIDAVVEVLRSGWLTTGPAVTAFEQEFAAFLGDPELHCVAVNSATAALHLAVEALGITEGDEVLVPTWTFTSTAEVVRYVGARPVFVDIDPRTLCIDLDDAQRKVTDRTRALIPVHFAGLPVSRTDLNTFCRRNHLRLIEDAAHSLPTANEGRLIGAIGDDDVSDAVCFSFYANKTMTTGEGGMVVTRNPELAQRFRTMRLHGISRDVFDRYRAAGASWYYEVIAPGFKYNLTDLAGAIGRVQLERAWDMAQRRASIAQRYSEAFAHLPVILPASESEDHGHAWHLYALRIAPDAPLSRNEFVSRMSTDYAIGCSMHFIPLHLQPYYRDTYGYQAQDFPHAWEAYGQEVSIPLFSAQSDDAVERVIHATHELLSR